LVSNITPPPTGGSSSRRTTRTANPGTWSISSAGPRTLEPKTVIKDSSDLNTNIFFDVTPALRTALSFNYTAQHYGDGAQVRNLRWFASAYYFF
jgi:hypothetical protein